MITPSKPLLQSPFPIRPPNVFTLLSLPNPKPRAKTRPAGPSNINHKPPYYHNFPTTNPPNQPSRNKENRASHPILFSQTKNLLSINRETNPNPNPRPVYKQKSPLSRPKYRRRKRSRKRSTLSLSMAPSFPFSFFFKFPPSISRYHVSCPNKKVICDTSYICHQPGDFFKSDSCPFSLLETKTLKQQ